ncbi:carnitine dehydratase, partial [Streptomyces sp. NPDC059766]
MTERLHHALENPVSSDEFDFDGHLEEILREAGLTPDDYGGSVAFTSGADPLVPGRFRLGSAAALALAGKGVAASAIWRDRGGEPQDVTVDVRKAFRRFAGFADFRWELINGRKPSIKWNKRNPFTDMPFFRRTKDGRSVVPLNIYPGLRSKALAFLGCPDTTDALNAAISGWDADDLEKAAADADIVLAKVRSLEEFLTEPQYTDVLADLPLIEIEKIGSSGPGPGGGGARPPRGGQTGRRGGPRHARAGR